MGLVLPQCTVDLLSFTGCFFCFMGQPCLACVSLFQPVFRVSFFIYPKNAAVFSRTNGFCGKKKKFWLWYLLYLSTFYFIIFILGPFKK